MFASQPPAVLLSQSLDEFLAQLPGIRDGSETAVHRSRVAIRRVREAIALARDNYDSETLADLETRLAAAFRALGRARDADVAQVLVLRVEERFPLAPAVVGHLRASIALSQLTARRKLIKKIEALELDSIDRALIRARRPWHLGRPAKQPWVDVLRDHVVGRASDVQRALEHAAGVYFPNRAHSARVHIKQLRYAVELASATGAWRPPFSLKPLRRAQEALGDAHDREVLLARADDLLDAGADLNPQEVNGLQQFLRREAMALHAKYLATRNEVLQICEVCVTWRQADRRHGRAMLVAGIAVPALLLLRRR